MGQIYYLGYYDIPENKDEGRHYEPAAGSKMTYIISALEELGYPVEVISPSSTRNRKFYPGTVLPIGSKSHLHLFPTWPYRPRILRILGRYLLNKRMMRYLLQHVQPDDVVIAYHSLALMKKIKRLKRLRNPKLILEVEEFYGDVMEKQCVSQKEQTYFQIADGYLFPAKRLAQKINLKQLPYAIIHGTYQCEPDRNCRLQDKIHCVYAGTLDPRKGGAIRAAEAARYLPENYHLHILGFGTEEQISQIQNLVQDISGECTCTISYDGCLGGEDYIRFLQSCHIGLSTQNPSGIYNDTSFPSKILSYMANGLQVVTVRIPVVEESAVHEHMHYYNEATGEAIADAICQAAQTQQSRDSRTKIAQLDEQFQFAFKALLEDL